MPSNVDGSRYADVNRDGYTNFAAYAFLEDPSVSLTPILDFAYEEDHLTIRHRRWTGANDLLYRYEISDDLQNWREVLPGSPELEITQLRRFDDSREEVELRLAEDAGAFIRIGTLED